MGRAHSLAWARAAKLPGTRLHPELAVLCGRDPEALQMDREVGAPEALAYLRRLNFQPSATSFDAAFARG
jgi:hypothetical protein